MAGEEILVIEDEEIWQDELRMILEKAGYKVVLAPSYEEAIESLKRDTVAAVTVDLSLVKGDSADRQGPKALKTKKLKMPIVFVTGYARNAKEGFELCKKFGGWFFDKGDFQQKPKQTKRELLAAIEETIEEYKLIKSREWKDEIRRLEQMLRE